MVDCSNNFSNARCREPKKLERIPIIPTRDNQNAIDFIPPISEVDNLFISPTIPPSIETIKLVDLPPPPILNKDIKNNIDHSDPLKIPPISNIGISDNVSKHPNFVEKVTESIIPENSPRLPNEGGFKFQVSTENQHQRIPASPIEDFKFQRKPFENQSIPASPLEDFKFQRKPFENQRIPASPLEDFKFQRKPFENTDKNISQTLDVPFLPEFNPVFPEVSNGEFSLDFNVKPTANPKKVLPISSIRVPSIEIVSQSSERPTINNIQTHFGQHSLVPSPLSSVEVIKDIKNEFGSTTSVPKPHKIKPEEDRRRPKANSDDFFKQTTVDILKDFSPSPKFPYPNTKGG